ncbi:MAG TPA: hypothetical protein VGA77_10810 [Propylenella sp.]|jgi:hypothetical protein
MKHIAAVLFLALVAAPLAGPLTAFGQSQPSDAEKQKVRVDCRGDFIRNCAGVTPGGVDALNCLVAHMSSLSDACAADINAIEVEMGDSGS